jgi:hypothetical protein
MIWWQWDDDGKCWRPTLVPPHGPWHLAERTAVVIPVTGTRRWALLAHDDAKVNGLPCLPFEVLDDQDEVRIAGKQYCFSSQTPAEVVAFVDENKNIRCARCLGRLVEGDRIIRCPGCRAHHHASCWSYDTKCQKCPSRTDDILWVPESLN